MQEGKQEKIKETWKIFFFFQLWSARSLLYWRIFQVFPQFRARGDEILHLYTLNDLFEVEKGKEKNSENFDFFEFFDFGTSFSIEFYVFSIQISNEGARSGRELGFPKEKK